MGPGARCPDGGLDPRGRSAGQPARPLGSIVELTPGPHGTAAPHVLLSGLTLPQGLAFARVAGHWVLYVGESDQIDRYPWGAGGISGARTVIAPHLPDLDPAGDDVHRPKDVAVAPDGTVYFGVGSSSNASPADRALSPPRAVIMAVNPDGSRLRVVEKGVRNGEGLAVAPDGSSGPRSTTATTSPYPVPLALRRAQRRLRPGDPGLRQRAPARRGRPGHGRAGPRLAVLQPRSGPEPPGRVAGGRAVRARLGDQPGRPAGWIAPPCRRSRSASRPTAPRSACPSWRAAHPGAVVGRGRGRGARLVGPPAAPRPGRAVAGLGRRQAHAEAGDHPGGRVPERRLATAGAAPSTRWRARTARST